MGARCVNSNSSNNFNITMRKFLPLIILLSAAQFGGKVNDLDLNTI